MELIKEIARNANIGIDAIDAVKKSVKDENFEQVVLSQRAKLCDIKDEAVKKIGEGKEDARPCDFQSAMMRGSVKMKAAFDGSNKNVAQMLIEGYNMGINSIVEESHKAGNDEKTPLVGELLELYDANIKELRQYL